MQVKHYIRDIVYGANDGIITTFAVVAGVIGANLEPKIVLVIGMASLLADGFSMAASDFLASRSHRAMVEVDGGNNDGEDRFAPAIGAGFTLFAFIIAGILPLLPYLFPVNGRHFFTASMMTGAALFVTGVLRTLVTRRRPLLAGVEMVGIGGIAALLAFGVGRLVSSLAGVSTVP